MTSQKELKKNRIILVAVLLFSSLSLILAFSMFLDIKMNDIQGIMQTSQITYVNGSKVYIPQNFINIWNDRYESENTEFLYCLYGGITDDNDFVITDITTTTILEYSESSISYIPCKRNREYLGNIHSHPQPETRYARASCELSQRDIFTFGKENQALTGVICGTNDVVMYGQHDLKKSFEIKILEDK